MWATHCLAKHKIFKSITKIQIAVFEYGANYFENKIIFVLTTIIKLNYRGKVEAKISIKAWCGGYLGYQLNGIWNQVTKR